MTAYIVATVRIHDADQFAVYGAAIKGLSAKFGGEPVVAGPVAEVLEGDGFVGERVVVTRFPDAVSARAYIASDQYQTAAVARKGAATVTMRLLQA